MVVILLAEGFEEIEALAPLDILRRSEIDVKTVSIGGREVTGTHGIKVTADLTADELDLNEVEAVILPGGMPGAINLDGSEITDRLIIAMMKRGGKLAAICAAPLILGRRGLLEGKRATCFPGFESELRGAEVCDCDVVADGNIITARNFKAALDFGFTLAKALGRSDEDGKAEEGQNEQGGCVSCTPVCNSSDDEIREIVNCVMKTLENFNVQAMITEIERGPRLIRLSIVPKRGVKVNQITDLFDEISLNLGANGIRMLTPIPDRTAIGIEIPTKNPTVVALKDLMDTEDYKNSTSPTTVCIGRDVVGDPVIGDLAKFPHVIVAGATGMGKSVCMHSMLACMISNASPDELKLILIDPKRVELGAYEKLPHLLLPIINDSKGAVGALKYAIDEMERRYDLIERANVRNIDAYNEANPEAKLPKIVIVIDELNDLMILAKDPIEDFIMRIAQKSRAAGIHLIIGTQRPDVKVLTGTIKANINTRICFKVCSVIDSRTAIECKGAEKLLDRGDMLFRTKDKTQPIRVQGCFISDNDTEAAIKTAIEKYGEALYDAGLLLDVEYAANKYFTNTSEDPTDDEDEDDDDSYLHDPQFLSAVDIAIQSGKVSTSLLQRKLYIGYGKAAVFIDTMEELGIISEQDGMKPRDVLISKSEWEKKLENL